MIVTLAEARIVLGLSGNISQADLALLDFLVPQANSAIINDPNYGLQYDPEYTDDFRVEYYPRIDPASSPDVGGTWDVNLTGTKAYWSDYSRNEALQLRHLPVR